MTTPAPLSHDWPADSLTHVWGAWMPFSQTYQFRKCCHPRCAVVQYREIKGDTPQPPTTERPPR